MLESDPASLAAGERTRILPQIAPKHAAGPVTAASVADCFGATTVSASRAVIVDADLAEIIGLNIRLARRLAGRMIQNDLAHRIGIPGEDAWKVISRYEHGHRMPPLARLKQIADELGQTVDWFLEPHDDEARP